MLFLHKENYLLHRTLLLFHLSLPNLRFQLKYYFSLIPLFGYYLSKLEQSAKSIAMTLLSNRDLHLQFMPRPY